MEKNTVIVILNTLTLFLLLIICYRVWKIQNMLNSEENYKVDISGGFKPDCNCQEGVNCSK